MNEMFIMTLDPNRDNVRCERCSRYARSDKHVVISLHFPSQVGSKDQVNYL